MSGDLVHEALVFEDDEALLAAAVPFLRDGVAAGEPTLLVVDARRQALLLDALDGDAGGVIAPGADDYATPLTTIRRNRALFRRLLAEGVGSLRALGLPPSGLRTWGG